MVERSEAQKRNEDEVRRIMEQRGYNTEAYRKKQRKNHRDFSVIPKVFVGVLLFAGVTYGAFFFFSHMLKGTKSSSLYSGSDMPRTSASEDPLYQCLSEAKKEDFNYTDEQFWDKLISQYNEMIKCYDTYPDSSDSESKKTLEQNLATAIANKEKERSNAVVERAYAQATSNNTDQVYHTSSSSTSSGCTHEYDVWMARDQEAKQAYAEANASGFTTETLHEKCDNASDPQACAAAIHAESSAKIEKAQTLISQAQTARQAYKTCLGN